MPSSYRNQLTDLQTKSVDWFLYEGNICLYGLMLILYGTLCMTDFWRVLISNSPLRQNIYSENRVCIDCNDNPHTFW